jgi:hypothetical protein
MFFAVTTVSIEKLARLSSPIARNNNNVNNVNNNMNVLSIAVETNNIGVVLLEQSLYADALEVFRSAADLMYLVTQELKAAQLSPEDRVDSSLTKMKIRSIQKKIQVITQSAGNKRRQVLKHSESDCFLHDCGLTLSYAASPATCALQSATIFLNMALSYHLSIPEGSSAGVPALRNAMTLYEMSYSVASLVEQTDDSSRIVMAALNNMAYIHHGCGLSEKSREVMDTLQAYIRQTTITRTPQGSSIFTEETRVYLLNAVFLHEPRGAAAA